MKRLVFHFTIVLVLAFTACACGRNENTLRIGAVLPMTGSVAYYGTSAQKGIELAVEELRATPDFKNTKIEVLYEDDQGQAKLAVTAMSKLANVDKVPAVIGGGTSTETMAAAPIANETKTVLISPISSAASISQAGDYIFRTCPADSAQAADLAAWVKESGISKVAVIYANSTWGTSLKDEFVKHFEAGEGTILDVKSSDPGDSDFRAQVTVFKSLKPDALVYVTYAKEGSALVRQTHELGLSVPIFGTDPWSQQDFRKGARDDANGVMYTTPTQYDGPSFEAFRTAFLRKYASEPDVYASNGYDCLKLLASAYVSGARKGPEFQAYLAKVSDFMGATGITKFDDNGDVVGKKFGRFVIQAGSPVAFR